MNCDGMKFKTKLEMFLNYNRVTKKILIIDFNKENENLQNKKYKGVNCFGKKWFVLLQRS